MKKKAKRGCQQRPGDRGKECSTSGEAGADINITRNASLQESIFLLTGKEMRKETTRKMKTITCKKKTKTTKNSQTRELRNEFVRCFSFFFFIKEIISDENVLS